jgi:hypothetical protein
MSEHEQEFTQVRLSTAEDQATLLDAVGAVWKGQPAYATLLVEWLGPKRTAAAGLHLVGALMELAAERADDVTPADLLAQVRGWVLTHNGPRGVSDDDQH